MKHFSLIIILLVYSCIAMNAHSSSLQNNDWNSEMNDSIKRQKLTQRAHTLINYYINVVSSLEQSPTIYFCESKKKEIINNLGIGQFKELPELKDILEEILNTLDQVKINEMDRELYLQVAQLKKKMQSTQALSNALSTPMSIFNVGSAGLNTVLTLARAGVDLAVAQQEHNIEMTQDMWNFERNNIVALDGLTNAVFLTAADVASNNDNIDFSEKAILRPERADEYNQLLSETDSIEFVKGLEKNTQFKDVYDYYYHLGMGYVKLGDYATAKEYFDTFLKNYDNPIFLKEPKIGMVALTRLLYEQNDLSLKEAEILINLMIGQGENQGHISDNDMAYLVASATYLNLAEKLKHNKYNIKAYECVDDGLSKMYRTGQSDVSLVAAVMENLDKMKIADESLHRDICRKILNKSQTLSVTEKTRLLFSLESNDMGDSFTKLFVLSKRNDNLIFSFDKSLKNILPLDSISLYDVYVKGDTLEIAEYLKKSKGYTKKEIKENLYRLNESNKEIKNAKDILTPPARFKYFFVKINPYRPEYCLIPGFSRDDYLLGGKFEDQMRETELMVTDKGNTATVITQELIAILDYCCEKMSDLSNLEFTVNTKHLAYNEALENYLKLKRNPIEDDLWNKAKEFGNWINPYGNPLDTKEEQDKDIEKYRAIMFKNFYTKQDNICFWGENLVHKPSCEQFASNTPYIQVVIGKYESTQIILTYNKEALKLISCRQGNNYCEF